MAIEKEKLYSSIYNELKSFLQEYVSDPKGRTKKSNAFIHSGFPNMNNYDFPIIVLECNISDDLNLFDWKKREITVSVMIDIYSKDASQLDTISNDIYSSFLNEIDELHNSKLFSPKIISSNISLNRNENGEVVYNRLFNINMRFRI